MSIPLFLRGPLIFLSIIIVLVALELSVGGFGQYIYFIFPCYTPPENSVGCSVGYDVIILLGLSVLGLGAVILMAGRWIELLILRRKKRTTKS